MSEVGADLSQLQDLQKAINDLHAAIHQNRPKITRLVQNQAIWKGPAANKFRGEWTNQFEKALESVSQGLVEAAKAVHIHHDNIARATGVMN